MSCADPPPAVWAEAAFCVWAEFGCRLSAGPAEHSDNLTDVVAVSEAMSDPQWWWPGRPAVPQGAHGGREAARLAHVCAAPYRAALCHIGRMWPHGHPVFAGARSLPGRITSTSHYAAYETAERVVDLAQHYAVMAGWALPDLALTGLSGNTHLAALAARMLKHRTQATSRQTPRTQPAQSVCNGQRPPHSRPKPTPLQAEHDDSRTG